MPRAKSFLTAIPHLLSYSHEPHKSTNFEAHHQRNSPSAPAHILLYDTHNIHDTFNTLPLSLRRQSSAFRILSPLCHYHPATQSSRAWPLAYPILVLETRGIDSRDTDQTLAVSGEIRGKRKSWVGGVVCPRGGDGCGDGGKYGAGEDHGLGEGGL